MRVSEIPNESALAFDAQQQTLAREAAERVCRLPSKLKDNKTNSNVLKQECDII